MMMKRQLNPNLKRLRPQPKRLKNLNQKLKKNLKKRMVASLKLLETFSSAQTRMR